MEIKRKRRFGLWFAVVGVLFFGATVYYLLDAIRRGEELEMKIAHMPVGITAEQADRIIGTVPNQVSQVSGVMVRNVTLYLSINSRAASYGLPKVYTLRTWNRGNVTATVAIDRHGRVAGRWTWKWERWRWAFGVGNRKSKGRVSFSTSVLR